MGLENRTQSNSDTIVTAELFSQGCQTLVALDGLQTPKQYNVSDINLNENTFNHISVCRHCRNTCLRRKHGFPLLGCRRAKILCDLEHTGVSIQYNKTHSLVLARTYCQCPQEGVYQIRILINLLSQIT